MLGDVLSGRDSRKVEVGGVGIGEENGDSREELSTDRRCFETLFGGQGLETFTSRLSSTLLSMMVLCLPFLAEPVVEHEIVMTPVECPG